MGQTLFPLDSLHFLGAPEVWPQQRDPRVPMGMWEMGGCLVVSQLRTSVQEKREHRRSSENFIPENSTPVNSTVKL